MRYSAEDQLREVMRRKNLHLHRRDSRITGLLSGIAVCLATAAAAVVSGFSGSEAFFAPDFAYGAFLLSSRSGSYVLCSVIAFVCGSLITVVCIRRKRKQDAAQAEKIRAPHTELTASNESTRT